jgi:hypothetical protein
MISLKCFGFQIMVLLKTCVFVFEIVSLKGLNKFDQIIFFPVTFWVKDFVHRCGKSFEDFSILGVNFLFILES